MDEGLVSDEGSGSEDESQPQRYRAPLRSVTAQQAAEETAARMKRPLQEAADRAAAEGARDRESASRRATVLLEQALVQGKNLTVIGNEGSYTSSGSSSGEVSGCGDGPAGRVLSSALSVKVSKRKKSEVKTMRREIDEW